MGGSAASTWQTEPDLTWSLLQLEAQTWEFGSLGGIVINKCLWSRILQGHLSNQVKSGSSWSAKQGDAGLLSFPFNDKQLQVLTECLLQAEPFTGRFYSCVLILKGRLGVLWISLFPPSQWCIIPLSTLGLVSLLFIICSLSLGPVFGNMDKFVGLGVFVDTYPNEEKQQEVMASVLA